MGLREHEIEMVDEIVSRVVTFLRDRQTSQGGDKRKPYTLNLELENGDVGGWAGAAGGTLNKELPCDHELPCKYGCSVVELDGSGATEFAGSGTVSVPTNKELEESGKSARLAYQLMEAVRREVELTEALTEAKAREVELTEALERMCRVNRAHVQELDDAADEFQTELDAAKAREVELTEALKDTGDLLKAVVAKAESVAKSAESLASMTNSAVGELFNVSGLKLPPPLLVQLRKVQQLVDELRGHL